MANSIVKSGPKKPRLENLTLCQWSVANLFILYKLVSDMKLVGPALMDYLSYTTKVYQLVQRYSLESVLLFFDREYRKLLASMNFRWGRDKPAAPASVAQLDGPSDWRPGDRGFNPR